MTVSAVSPDRPEGDNRREWPRYRAEREFSLTATLDGHLLTCRVADVSLGGARLQFNAEPPHGGSIALSHPDSRTVTCRRVWQAGPEIGVEFDFSEDSLGLISICIRNMIETILQPQVVNA